MRFHYYHLKAEADPALLNDHRRVESMLLAICYAHKFQPFISPLCFYVDPAPGRRPGLSCLLMMHESHIAYHSFSDEKVFYLTVVSCLGVDPGAIYEIAQGHLGFEKAEVLSYAL